MFRIFILWWSSAWLRPAASFHCQSETGFGRCIHCPTKPLHTTPDGRRSPASRFTAFGPACVSSIVRRLGRLGGSHAIYSARGEDGSEAAKDRAFVASVALGDARCGDIRLGGLWLYHLFDM